VPGRFIAKQELSTWPVFGILAKLARTIFISRSSSSAVKQLQLIEHVLFRSERLILFPEGTSSDGRKVLPFKPSLFEAPIQADAIVQPLTIRYEKINGMPVDLRSKPLLAWYGAMDLLPHLWQSLSVGTITIKIVFHKPIRAIVFSNRKKLASHCQKIIALESEKSNQ
jgi:1-acyl-sn-glycerol-3-phosphate acyltransferase